jgi:hypothetical protein
MGDLQEHFMPDDEIWYLYSVFCRVNLPRRKVLANDYCYQHAKWSIFISSSILQENNVPVLQEIIYGTKARLLLIAINTYAIVNRTTEITLSRSFNQLLAKLNLAPRGGSNSPSQYLKEQIKALITCHITICTEKTYLDINPIRGAWGVDLFNKDKNKRSGDIVISLSSDYYELLLTSSVPLRKSHILSLKNSALALDIYTWLTLRAFEIEDSKRPIKIRWVPLKSQFGQEYSCKKSFKREFKKKLQRVIDTHPFNVSIITGGILLKPSPRPVKPFQLEILETT